MEEEHDGPSGIGGRSVRRREVGRLRGVISRKKEERGRLVGELREKRVSGTRAEVLDLMHREKTLRQDLFVLQQRVRAVRAGADHEVGALPDFAIIGAPKCGTTFLYHLLAKHPLVLHTALKEPHYFDLFYEKGDEWYRRCFPPPRVAEDGRKTVSCDATPGYLAHPKAPRRMARLVPRARLIALLRNPVDRVYSGYHFFGSRRGWDTAAFGRYVEEAFRDPHRTVLSKGVYVDQILRWREFYAEDRMLVIKSEDFFADPRHTLHETLDFLELPAWEPGDADLGERRNKGSYERGIDPETRRRMEEFYEPHNRRLYELLGVDFGW